MKQRKSRNKINKSKVNMMEPIPFEILGTDNDCFGKLHDPTASECGQCGDAEICAIACSQKLHLKRKAIEAEQPFKDIKPEHKTSITWKKLYRVVKRFLKKYPKGIRVEVLEKKMTLKLQLSKEEYEPLMELVCIKKKKFLKVKDKLITWKR